MKVKIQMKWISVQPMKHWLWLMEKSMVPMYGSIKGIGEKWLQEDVFRIKVGLVTI